MKKILIFDSDPSTRELLAEELAAEGHVTITLGKAESLGPCAERFEPDLIVLDLDRGGKILQDLLIELKTQYPAIPILPFTAFRPRKIPRFRRARRGHEKASFLTA